MELILLSEKKKKNYVVILFRSPLGFRWLCLLVVVSPLESPKQELFMRRRYGTKEVDIGIVIGDCPLYPEQLTVGAKSSSKPIIIHLHNIITRFQQQEKYENAY